MTRSKMHHCRKLIGNISSDYFLRPEIEGTFDFTFNCKLNLVYMQRYTISPDMQSINNRGATRPLFLIEYSVCDMKIYLINITSYSLVNSEIHNLQFDFEYRVNEKSRLFK